MVNLNGCTNLVPVATFEQATLVTTAMTTRAAEQVRCCSLPYVSPLEIEGEASAERSRAIFQSGKLWVNYTVRIQTGALIGSASNIAHANNMYLLTDIVLCMTNSTLPIFPEHHLLPCQQDIHAGCPH
jgi:hypothetical protein